MSYLNNIMQEEHQRLQALYKIYVHNIKLLPKGAVSIKKRNEIEYLYLAGRRDGKVKFDYIGPVVSERARNVLEQVVVRKNYEQKLKQVKSDLKKLEKAIHGLGALAFGLSLC